jgi:hypothetical protein
MADRIDPIMGTRSISPLEVVMMVRRFLILIAAVVVPLSLMVGLTMQAAVAQGTSTAAITPASGPAGTPVTGTGANWRSGDHIQAQWGDDYSNLGSPVVVASDGTFKGMSFAIPSNATTGTHQVLIWDEESRYFVVANFNVTKPTLSLSPNSGHVGTHFTITGTGWCPSDTVNVHLPYGSLAIFYGQVSWPADSSGNWQTSATVGDATPPGTYQIYFTQTACNGLQLTGSFTNTLQMGTWAGTTGPYYANYYYGYPYSNPPVCQANGTNCVKDQWKFFEGQCTSWVAYRLSRLNRISFSDTYRLPAGNPPVTVWGNASQWKTAANAIGIKVDGTPALGVSLRKSCNGVAGVRGARGCDTQACEA